MKKRRWILTPDETLDMAKAMFQSAFGERNHQPVEGKTEKSLPVLLPKPERVVTSKGEGVTIQKLRKAQKLERQRSRFNKTVRKDIARKYKALVASWKEQVRAAKAAYRAAVKQQRELAQKALKAAEEARRAAENLRKQIQAAREWLKLEEARKRELESAAKERIRKARACGFRLLSTYCSSEQEWGASCPLFAIRGLAAAAAAIWAAEQAK
jgi:hypothetical protein